MENSVVSITNLLKRFPVGGDFFTALKQINLKLQKGEFTGLVGPSGSGKNMGFIFQSYNLLPVYTVFENVELPLILNKVDPQERDKKVTQAIEWVGLSDKTKSRPAMLSGGECQRTAIARAIVHEPTLVLADEPTANLDAENSHHIMNIMVKLNKELSTSFIFATHDEKIMDYLRRIIHLDDGQIINDELIDRSKSGG
jgi:putative ABC transport system ATP-binding protein